MQVTHCRACSAGELEVFLDLGRTALANRFLRAEDLRAPEPKFPLRLALCNACGLVQLDEEVDPTVLFADYIYFSGTSDLVHRQAAWLADTLIERYAVPATGLVVEAASNDGTVLKAFQKRGVRVLGIEPAANIAECALADGVPTECRFFGEAAADELFATHGAANLVLARHVLAHVPDLCGFVRGMGRMLAPGGVAVVEAPHLLPFYERLEFDTVYHEHLCYFSLTVLKSLFERCGLQIIQVDEREIHGGSIVVAAQRMGGTRPVHSSVPDMLRREAAAGLTSPVRWHAFAERIQRVRRELTETLTDCARQGLRLAGYGAAAKGNTLLAACNIGPELLPYIVDRSPHKQGLYTPGLHIPVCAPERLLAEQPDVLLLLAWNFAPEIMAQQAEYERRGGFFLLPLPTPTFAGRSKRCAA